MFDLYWSPVPGRGQDGGAASVAAGVGTSSETTEVPKARVEGVGLARGPRGASGEGRVPQRGQRRRISNSEVISLGRFMNLGRKKIAPLVFSVRNEHFLP